MASHSKGKGSKHTPYYHSGLTNWNRAPLILNLVNEAEMLSPIAELQHAASVTLTILRNIQMVKDHEEAYARLGDDASGLIVVIWHSYKKTEYPDQWLSPDMREILEDLTHTLENISSFIQEHISRKKRIRVILGKGDAAGRKISEYREHLGYAMQKFEFQYQMNVNDVLLQITRKNEQVSGEILHRIKEEEDVQHALELSARDARDKEIAEKFHQEETEILEEISNLELRKQAEIDREAEELKRIEKEINGRKTELERLRATASAIEEANRLKKAEEEEIAQLKRTLAAEEENRRRAKIQAQSSIRNKICVEEDETDEEQEEWGGSFIVEAATSEEEEEEEELPVRKSPKVKKNHSGSPKRRPMALDHSSDDDEENVQRRRGSKTKPAHRKPSSTSLRDFEETEDESTDDDIYMPLPSRKNRKRRNVPISPFLDVDDLMGNIKDFIPFETIYASRSDPHLSSPTYTHSNPYFAACGAIVSPPPRGPYGLFPGTIISSGVGNITNATIANVGNDNSVKTVYHTRRTSSPSRIISVD